MAFLEKLLGRSETIFTYLPDDQALSLSNEPDAVKRSQLDGERDIYRLTQTAIQEGSWIYAADKNTWFNIRTGSTKSYNQKTGSYSYSVGTARVKNYARLGENLTHYHTHNRPIFEEVVRLSNRTVLRSTINFVIPSEDDIEGFLYLRNHMAAGEINFKIFHPFGITTTHFSIKMAQNSRAVKDLIDYYTSTKYKILDRFQSHQQDAVQLAVEYINQATVGFLELKVSPYPPDY